MAAPLKKIVEKVKAVFKKFKIKNAAQPLPETPPDPVNKEPVDNVQINTIQNPPAPVTPSQEQLETLRSELAGLKKEMELVKGTLPATAPQTPVQKGQSLLTELAKGGDCDTKKALELISTGASLEKTDKERRTALMLALRHGHEGVALVLIEKSTNLDASDKYSNTALITAAEHGSTRAALALIDKNVSLDTKNGFGGKTALMYAAEHGHARIVAALLDRGANPDEKTNGLRDALAFAGKHPESAKLIKAAQERRALIEERRIATLKQEAHDTEHRLLVEARREVACLRKELEQLSRDFNGLVEKLGNPPPDEPKTAPREKTKSAPKKNS